MCCLLFQLNINDLRTFFDSPHLGLVAYVANDNGVCLLGGFYFKVPIKICGGSIIESFKDHIDEWYWITGCGIRNFTLNRNFLG